jgi:hypothetical protein
MAKVDVAVMINDVTGKMGTAVAKAATAVGLTLVPYCLTGARRSTHRMLRPHCRTSWTGARGAASATLSAVGRQPHAGGHAAATGWTKAVMHTPPAFAVPGLADARARGLCGGEMSLR